METGDGEERWLEYDYNVRCGSAVYEAYRPVVCILLVVYVILVPLALLCHLHGNRRRGVGDGPLSFLTRHVRDQCWWC